MTESKGSAPPARKARRAAEPPAREQVQDISAAAASVQGCSVKRLSRAIKRIRGEWEARGATARTSGINSRSATLKKAVYALVGKMRAQGLTNQEILDLVAIYRGKKLRKSLLSDNPFQAILIAVFPDDGLNRAERARYARLLSYADQNKVPIVYLIGFTLQHGEAASRTDRLPLPQQPTEVATDNPAKKVHQRKLNAATRVRKAAQKAATDRKRMSSRRRRHRSS